MSDFAAPHDDELVRLAVLYAMDAVPPAELQQLTALSAEADPDRAQVFTRTVREARETMAALSAADATIPPDALRARILAALSEHDRAVARLSERRRRARSLLAAAAAVLVAVGALFVVTRVTGDRPDESGTAQVLHAADAHTRTADFAGGTVTVTATGRLHSAVVSMSGVAAPPPEHVYQLWLRAQGTVPRSVGTVDASSMPADPGVLVTGLGSANALAITLEPGSGSQQPSGPMLAVLPVR